MATTVVDVRVEHHRSPVGIGEPAPRLSWRVETDLPRWRQQAYEIEISDADGARSQGRVESEASLLVPWPSAPLRSRERRTLRVRVWGEGDVDASPWSDPVQVEAGLLDATDWRAELVGAAPAVGPDEQPVLLLRGEFVVERPVRRARLYATAHGVYEAELDGEPVGDQVLAPGWTSYGHRLRYQTYDLTTELPPGRHVLGLRVADGWFRGHLGFTGEKAFYGSDLAVLAQLELEHDDGSTATVVTDGSWTWSPSGTTSADLYNGETCDLRLEPTGWSTPAFDASGWLPVATSEADPSVLVAPTGPPVRRTETVHPVSLATSPSGAVLVDFGVNLVGRVRLHLPAAEAGTSITLRHAEVLEHGELGTRPLRTARATDTVVLDGLGVRDWEPRFTFHGFRYVEVSGWPGALGLQDLEAVVLHTDLERTGTFACSDPDVTRLHENVVRGMRGNVLDVPTDCPQRDERLGWTGDLAVFAPTAQFLYDTTGMLTSWLQDLAAEQNDGVVPLFVPFLDIMPPQFPRWPVECGWGDAAVTVPWTLYEATGDRDLLERQWPSMAAWMHVFEQRAGVELDFPDGGVMLGDWLDPSAPDDQPWAARAPWPLVATAFLARSAQLMARSAEVLDRDDDQVRFAELADRAARRFRDAYLDADGRIVVRAQTAYALAIAFDLLEPVQRQHAGDDLASQVEEDGFRIGTGFLGTPYVCDALTATGHTATAYRLLLQKECPSWLYAVSLGATTVWERWNSMLPDGSINPGEMTSFNHYAFGAVADWLHRTVGGLACAAPGWRHLMVAPQPGGGIAWATTSLRTPYGEASASWRIVDDIFHLDLVVPPGSDADVRLPDGTAVSVGGGPNIFSCTAVLADATAPSGDRGMNVRTFPAGFLWGVASAGHQTEGGNVDSDTWFAENVTPTVFRERSGRACNGYELWADDVDLAASFGLTAYRFSVEWARVEPVEGEIDEKALAHYEAIVDRCLDHGMAPIVTFNHFTSPHWFAMKGGWLDPAAPQAFARYCTTVMEAFGDRIAYAVTMNENNLARLLTWIGLPDFVRDLERATLAAASAAAGVERYRLSNVMLPEEMDALADGMAAGHRAAKAAIKALRPDLPVGMSIAIVDDVAVVGGEAIVARKRREVYERWLDMAREDDFVGVQNYERIEYDAGGPVPVLDGVPRNQMGSAVEPQSLAGAVRYAYEKSGVPVLVTEHGVSTNDDALREGFIVPSLQGLLDVIDDGVPVLGYCHWTLMDNFEWIFGYSHQLGLVAVDRESFERTPKPSAHTYADVVRQNGVRR